MSKFKPKYNWRDREWHFQWLRLADANRESREIWMNQWQEDAAFFELPFFTRIARQKLEKRNSLSPSEMYTFDDGRAVSERLGEPSVRPSRKLTKN